MLARGVLCRLAADVPKTSTHDLARISRVLHRAINARSASSIASIGGLSHAYKLAYALSRRSYATAAATAKKPTKTVKKVTVKETVTKKPAAKKTAVKKTAAKKKTATKKKAAPTKKRAAKKAAPKRKPAKRALTEAGKARKELAEQRARHNELKEAALMTLPKKLPISAWMVYVSEIQEKGKGKSPATEIMKQGGAQFKALTPAEREHYNHLANQNKAANEAAYKEWVLSHTPEQIRLANNARRQLRAQYTKLKNAGNVKSSRVYPKDTGPIKDERRVKRPQNAYMLFNKERRDSGEMKGISVPDSSRLITSEYKALSASEKKKYEDLALAAKKQYAADFAATYGHKSQAAVA
ncbi:hypothetical protein BU16DRAFT_538827 [Lophium mytilinum]|uniref:HMG box domain-containing protein n=1 Tax=Lophium mytilinum TaxID=390894 RepID=A0A6A6QWM6_9PEZI|nr:hypothetical protein BU16DRAFT_538827 [Lophium mytilinum]